jgi:hypothetical protein
MPSACRPALGVPCTHALNPSLLPPTWAHGAQALRRPTPLRSAGGGERPAAGGRSAHRAAAALRPGAPPPPAGWGPHGAPHPAARARPARLNCAGDTERRAARRGWGNPLLRPSVEQMPLTCLLAPRGPQPAPCPARGAVAPLSAPPAAAAGAAVPRAPRAPRRPSLSRPLPCPPGPQTSRGPGWGGGGAPLCIPLTAQPFFILPSFYTIPSRAPRGAWQAPHRPVAQPPV